MRPDLPLISAVIPAYNAAATIGRSLGSVCQQDYANLEVIVVDDGSRDGTAHIVECFGDSRVRLVQSPCNAGVAAARNLGIDSALGDYVAFLDADDEWLPGKIGLQAEAIIREPAVTLVSCNTLFVNETGAAVSCGHSAHPPQEGVRAWAGLLRDNFIPTPTVLARRADLRRLGGFNPTLPVAEDLDLWIRLALRGSVRVLSETLVVVHLREGSLMRRYAERELEIAWPMLRKHLCMQAGRLTGREARAIRGKRMFDFGARLLWQGVPRKAMPLFWDALRSGHAPLESAFAILKCVAHASLTRSARSVPKAPRDTRPTWG